MMAYNWSRYNDTTRLESPLFIKCRFYVAINNKNQAKVYFYFSYPHPNNLFFNYTFSQELVDNIISSSSKIDSVRLIENPDRPRIYDGPSFKLKILYSENNWKLFEFIDDPYEPNVKNFLEIYYQLSKIYRNQDSINYLRSVSHISDSVGFEKSRLDFVNFVGKYDSTHHIPPPSPSNILPTVKYSPPDDKIKN